MSVYSDIACSVDDVAAVIRARTKDSEGNEVGTFNADTRPTDVQVQEHIAHAMVLVHTKVGFIGDTCTELARSVVALGAAAEIELSYFPEQSRTDRSAYTFLEQRYAMALDGLAECVMGALPSSADTPGGGTVQAGTLDVISGVVYDHYTGNNWPPLPQPDPPHVTPYEESD